MKTLSVLVCGAALFALSSCSSPKSDGEKYIKLCKEAIEAAKEGDTEKAAKLQKEAEEFCKECEKKYGDDKEKSLEFAKAAFGSVFGE